MAPARASLSCAFGALCPASPPCLPSFMLVPLLLLLLFFLAGTHPRNEPENLGWYPRSSRSKILLVVPSYPSGETWTLLLTAFFRPLTPNHPPVCTSIGCIVYRRPGPFSFPAPSLLPYLPVPRCYYTFLMITLVPSPGSISIY